MRPLLALLLALAGPSGAGEDRVVVRQEGAPPDEPTARLESPADVLRLCAALVPVERLRPEGDAVDRGEAESRHEAERQKALRTRYEVRAPAQGLVFANYDVPGQRLSLAEPVLIPPFDAIARFWPAKRRGLEVEVDAEMARRLLRAQEAGTLELALVFDLADDTTCGAAMRVRRFTLPIEPVSWRWLDGDAVLARGGAAADRPALTAEQGAQPRVVVGEPLAGPRGARTSLALRIPQLVSCYGEALRRSPALDGLLVAEMGGGRAAIAADSVGDDGLAACVLRVVRPLSGGPAGPAAVPIRFELAPPGASARAP